MVCLLGRKGIVTLATFTCHPREAVIGRRLENQWLGELQRGTGPLQNPLFLANVTMPAKAIRQTMRDWRMASTIGRDFAHPEDEANPSHYGGRRHEPPVSRGEPFVCFGVEF